MNSLINIDTISLRRNITLYKSLGKRNSNIEALRIISMFMILMLHVNFSAIGYPTKEIIISSPIPTGTRIMFEMISLPAVNIFVMISGWFGIKTTFKSVIRFIFQCTFMLLLIFVAVCFILPEEINIKDIGFNLLLIGNNGAWFIPAYLFLMLMAPILNLYVDNSSKRRLKITIFSFFVLQTLFYLSPYIGWGNSAFSFIGLYLLARYTRIYVKRTYNIPVWIYFASLVCMIASYYGNAILFNDNSLLKMFTMSYANPLVILNALCVVIIFANLKPRHNIAVNLTALSAFAVYLFHNCNSYCAGLYKEISRILFADYSGLDYLWRILVFIIVVYIIALLIDQVRIVLQNYLFDKFFKRS